jgi:hypothetical protein
METAIAIRTPDLIAAEINSIKSQTRTMVLCNSIEIGRCLVEGKSVIPHGEWGKWLEASVDYSQSTANNLMRIFDEYGANQLALFGAEAKSQALGSLSYTQAVAMLGVPAEEREDFIKENDIDNMSTRELQQAIKDRDQIKEQLEKARQIIDEKSEKERLLREEKFGIEREKRLVDRVLTDAQADVKLLQDSLRVARDDKKTAEEKYSDILAALNETKKQLAEAEKNGDVEEVTRLQSELEQADQLLVSANEEIAELKARPIDVQATTTIEKIPEEVEQELAHLRQQNKSVAILKYTLCFNHLVKGFQDLLGALDEIKKDSPDDHERYQHATLELISKMSAKL